MRVGTDVVSVMAAEYAAMTLTTSLMHGVTMKITENRVLKTDKRKPSTTTILLVSSTNATCFGHTDHPQALNTRYLNAKSKALVDDISLAISNVMYHNGMHSKNKVQGLR